MNKIVVKKLRVKVDSAETIAGIFDQENVEFHSIAKVNWTEFPYQPTVSFRIAQDGKSIFLNYQVNEKSIRARYKEDNGKVWTDSCVEFFIMPEKDGIYYNFESNCIGTILLGAGSDRYNRTRAPKEIVQQIQRYSSLGNCPFEEKDRSEPWEVSLVIPVSCFFQSSISDLSGLVARCNFYKCGDELSTPHFLSWNPIESLHPDFHLPMYFGEIKFQ